MLYLLEMGKAFKLLRDRMRVELTGTGLLRGQLGLIYILTEQEGLTQSDLAHQLCIQPATLSNTLDRMEKAHLVERRDDPRDQRVSRVYLTPQGRDLRGQVDCTTAHVTQDALAGFSVTEQEQLAAYIHRIIHNLQTNLNASEMPKC